MTEWRDALPGVLRRIAPFPFRRIVLAGVLAYAAAAKGIEGPVAVAALPWWLSWAASSWARLGASVLEAGAAVLLLTSRWTMGLWLTIVLGTAFTFFVVLLRRHGIDPALCGCLGAQRLAFGPHLALLLGMQLLAFSGLVRA